MQNIHYNPIQLGGGEFRILILQPSSTFSSDIICTLMNVSLESHPPYEALSYVWGDTATSGSTIILEGKSKGVTENLAAALRHLRLESEPRKLWVDALCIDQEDINERDEQVIHMKEIYQHCATDLLWLGDDSSIIEKGAAAMKSMGPVTQLGEDSLETHVEPYWREIPRGRKREKSLEQQWFEAISALLGKPKVWKRVWIMQEVSFAPRVVLVSGNATLPWDRVEEFLDAENYIRKYGFPDAFHGPFSHGMGSSLRDVLTFYLASAQILAHQRRIAAAMQQPPQQSDNLPPTSSLLDVLARFRHTDATDPRDKVFALLGLTSNPLSITPTYHDSKRQVYTKTATAIINASGNLDLLCQSPWGVAGTADRDASLPSWVPNFANAGYNSYILFAQRGIYAPAGDEQLQTPCTTTDDGRLPLEGWDAGELRKLHPHALGLRTLKMPDEVLREGIEAGNESLRLLLSSSEDPHRRSESQDGDDAEGHGSGAGLRRFEQYWRTLMLDCKRYPVTRLDEDDVRDLRPKWEAWLRIPYVMKTWTLSSGEVFSAPFSEKGREAEHGIRHHSEHAWGMRFAVLEDGRYAMMPRQAEEGDRVAVLKGAKTPVVLRMAEGMAQGDGKEVTWTLIGPCYVHGLMDGQILEKGRDTRTFVLA
ncbi:Heterokaryon incompatibility [Lasiodiplodia theobromae]|uniref:Heterokaryon incompatibility n=1 Tax=Lasiodiplodia theobromae TaxID=45133 RepID=A0A8H7IRM2_9PEZI|nr:Heterokaryon incompatibility [Lasiodiplodia theobromae]